MKPVKAAVVGLGRLGGRHAENVARRVAGAELAALCDADAARLAVYAERLNVPRRTRDFDQLLAIDEIEAIVLVSPSVFHPEHISKALDAGKHVFSEKPLGVTAEDCLAAEQAVNRHPELVFMPGFMRRFDESYAFAHQRVKAGDIGKPLFFRGVSQDPAEGVREAIAFAPTSGGLFLDMAVHDIDLARWFLGSDPEAVWAIGDCYAYPEFAECGDIDNGSCLMKFKNGAMACLFAGRTAPHGYNVESEIVGTERILRISSVPQRNLVEIMDGGGVRRECFQRFLDRFGPSYLNEVQEFFDCVREGRKPEITVRDGARATRIAYKCKESLATGKLVETGL
ncbi:MAG: Gfo/Idh/MocA family oxidoreductase [Planctomycetota bacterium]|jgi:myo-inositol 2-dehydrogenase/D-chiro-inositol 1-dehydrogenase|nr:Gfo/Idh/MocA family oxidoreductase [Planctomycetota bacterium]